MQWPPIPPDFVGLAEAYGCALPANFVGVEGRMACLEGTVDAAALVFDRPLTCEELYAACNATGFDPDSLEYGKHAFGTKGDGCPLYGWPKYLDGAGQGDTVRPCDDVEGGGHGSGMIGRRGDPLSKRNGSGHGGVL